MSEAWVYTLVYLAWLAGAACFVLGLHRMNSPATGRSGNQLSAAGMTIAVVATLIYLATREAGPERHRDRASSSSDSRSVAAPACTPPDRREDDRDAAAGVAVQCGRWRRRRPRGDRGLHPTQRHRDAPPSTRRSSSSSGALIGSVTFTGSLIAGGKLQGLIAGKPIYVPGGQLVTIAAGAGRRGRHAWH